MKDKNIISKSSKAVADTTDSILNQLKNGLSRIAELGSNSKDKFTNYVSQILDILPLIEKAGFRTNRLIVGISVPPSIEIHVSRFKEIDDQTIDELFEEYKERKMFKLILKSLLMANEFQGKLSSEELIFSEICLEISIPPKVSIKYLNKDIAGLNQIEMNFD